MSPASSWLGSGSKGLTQRPETVCRYGPGPGGPWSGVVMIHIVVIRMTRVWRTSTAAGEGGEGAGLVRGWQEILSQEDGFSGHRRRATPAAPSLPYPVQ